MRTSMNFTAAGDAIIQRRIPNDFEGYSELAPFIEQGDARFFNLETTLCREGECFASQFSGGTYLRTVPEVLDDLKRFGFNMTTFNNNHAMDFSYDGLYKTLDALEQSGLIHAGVGKNLDLASCPRYFDTKNGRVALISVSTSFEPSMMAGNATARYPGRPGVNGIRLQERLFVLREEFEYIKKLAMKMKINSENEISRHEGYLPKLPHDVAEFGEIRFEIGDECKRMLELNEPDLKRIEKSLYEASFAADYTVLSIHSHELDGDSKEEVPAFLAELAHKCIDMGADAIIGHGPHLLRPIEIYCDKPIFYSLGDFILELYSVESAPADFFMQQELSPNQTVCELLKTRSKNFTVGLMEDRKMNQSVIPFWETYDRKMTALKLMPIELIMKGKKSDIGLPRKATSFEAIERLAEMSNKYGIVMQVGKDGIVDCKW